MQIAFAAPIVRAAIVSLQASLPGQITLFNAEAANTVDLEAPQTYHFGGTDTLAAFAFPQIEVMAGEGRFGTFTIGRGQADHDPLVNVVAWHEVSTGEVSTGYELALGMTRCLIEVLTRPGAFGGDAEVANDNGVYWRIDVLPADPTSDGRTFAKWRVPAFVQFRLETVERFG